MGKQKIRMTQKELTKLKTQNELMITIKIYALMRYHLQIIFHYYLL
jgi:hypothetical protein